MSTSPAKRSKSVSTHATCWMCSGSLVEETCKLELGGQLDPGVIRPVGPTDFVGRHHADADLNAVAERRARSLDRLRARDFRNLRRLELTPGPRFNVVSGDDGQGKSNLLEAIEYLGSLRSFRGARVEGLGSRSERAAPNCRDSRAARDRASRLAPHAGDRNSAARRTTRRQAAALEVRATVAHFPAVVLSSQASSRSVPAARTGRRGFLDLLLTRLDETYATSLAAYTRALASRNRLLPRGLSKPSRHHGVRRAVVGVRCGDWPGASRTRSTRCRRWSRTLFEENSR